MPGRIWEGVMRDGKTPVWLLEWELSLHRRRRVLVAVDTSDSCSEHRPAIQAFFRQLAEVLDAGDCCAVWVLGRPDAAREYGLRRSADRMELPQALLAGLCETRGGTWLGETLRGMKRYAAGSAAAGARDFLMLLSDGEIFDADVLLWGEPSPIGFVRLGERSSDALEVVRKRTVSVCATPAGLKAFLACPAPCARLEPNWTGVRTAAFVESGNLSDGDALSIREGQSHVRVAFVGGAPPSPRVIYTADGAEWTDEECRREGLSREAPPYLRRVLRELAGNAVDWDCGRLAELAAKGASAAFTCGRCKAPSQPGRIFCRRCGGLLLSRDVVPQRELPVHGLVRFRIGSDGGVLPVESPACAEIGDLPFRVIEDEEGTWLVVDLSKV